MAFKKGDKRPEGAGVKKGQKQKRTMMREMLEEKGIDLVDEMAGIIALAKKHRDYQAIMDACKTLLPYCYKKMPTDHNVAGEMKHSVNYEDILTKAGIKPRSKQ